MKLLYNIREFFFPLLEGEADSIPDDLKLNELKIDDDGLEIMYQMSLKNYQDEDNRKDKVEAKSSLFIGTSSIITTVTFAVTAILFNTKDYNNFPFLLAFILLFFLIYLSRTLWFSIKALERKPYDVISHTDILRFSEKSELLKNVIIRIINATRKNYIHNNQKVDYMTMAQEYYKRAIVSFTLYSVLLFVFFAGSTASNSSIDLQQVIKFIITVSQINWLFYTSVLLNLVLAVSVIRFRRTL